MRITRAKLGCCSRKRWTGTVQGCHFANYLAQNFVHYFGVVILTSFISESGSAPRQKQFRVSAGDGVEQLSSISCAIVYFAPPSDGLNVIPVGSSPTTTLTSRGHPRTRATRIITPRPTALSNSLNSG